MPNHKQIWSLLLGGDMGVIPSPPAFPNTYSLDFDGVDESLNCGNKFSFTDKITVSAWIKVGTWINYETFVSQINTAGSFLLNQNTSTTLGSLYFAIYQSDGTFKQTIGTGVAPTSDWFHYVGVADGSFVRMYVDGSPVGTPTAYDGTIRTSTDDLVIGGRANGSYMSDCLIDEVAIWNGTGLSASQVSDLYNNGLPTNLNSFEVTPEVWYRDGDSTKALFFNSIWQIPNEMKVDNFSRYSMYFDGVGDSVGLGSSVDLGTTSTISFWCKTTSVPDGKTIIGEDSYSYDYVIQFKPSTTTTFVRIGSVVKPFTTTELNDGNWNHWCIVRNGDSVELFINAVSKGTQTGYGTGTNTLFDTIGSESGASGTITGSIADVSAFNQVVSASTLYNSGTPTDLSEESGLVGYWRMGEGANWNNTNWQLPDYSKKALFSQKSFELDGVDDYVDLGTSSDLKPSNVSFSAWYYPEAVGTKGAIISSGNKTGGWSPYSINHWTTDKLCLLMSTDTNNQVFSTATLSYNQWYHIAVTYDGSSAKIYIDGSLDSTHSFSGNIDYSSMADDEFFIGRRPGYSQYLSGKIDDVSIFNIGLSAVQIAAIYNSGVPKDESTNENLIGYWTFDDATYGAAGWNVPDNSSNSNNGTSSGMIETDLLLESPTNSSSGTSSSMAIDDRVTDAPDNENQANSVNMEEGDRSTDVPT